MLVSIKNFPPCEVKGNTVKDLVDVLTKLDPDKKLYFIKVSWDGQAQTMDAYDLEFIESSKIDGTEDGYTITI